LTRCIYRHTALLQLLDTVPFGTVFFCASLAQYLLTGIAVILDFHVETLTALSAIIFHGTPPIKRTITVQTIRTAAILS